jgi:hypothetical protein
MCSGVAFDLEAGQEPVEPARDPPVPVAEQVRSPSAKKKSL